jgi:hypothetical protein
VTAGLPIDIRSFSNQIFSLPAWEVLVLSVLLWFFLGILISALFVGVWGERFGKTELLVNALRGFVCSLFLLPILCYLLLAVFVAAQSTGWIKSILTFFILLPSTMAAVMISLCALMLWQRWMLGLFALPVAIVGLVMFVRLNKFLT